jgi:hypothetical protein
MNSHEIQFDFCLYVHGGKMTFWTKQAAIQRMENNKLLQEILQTEPRLLPIIETAKNQKRQRGYNRVRTYIELRNQAMSYVGHSARNEQLSSSRHYDAVIRTIDDLLPPDEIDLAD